MYSIYYDFFFFKQKTAYEMRISDWSSDVCSSDLKSIVIGHYPSAKCSDMTRQVFAFAKFGKERCAYVGQIYHVLQKPERAANLTEADSLWIPDRKSTRLNSSH